MNSRPLRLIPFFVIAAAAALFTFRPTYDPDLFWHLAQGRHDVQSGLVHTNIFSAAHAAYPQHYTSWGFEVVQYFAERSLGLLGVQAFQWVLLCVAFAMLYASARTKGSRAVAFTILLLALFVVEPRAMPRPYLVSFTGFAFCSWYFNRSALTTDHWPLIIALAVWSNFHSESLFGLAFVAFSVVPQAGAAVSKMKLLVLCTLATLATPYSWGLWRYLYENTAVPSALRIAELEPPTMAAYPAFFAFLAILALALLSMPRRLKWPEAAIVVFFAALGLRYIRFMPMIVFVAAPILADRIQAWIERGWDTRAVVITAIAVMFATAPASPRRMIAAWRIGEAALAPKEYFSAEAVEFIRANGLTPPMFNSMNLGGYLDWHLGGGTFIDSRLQAAPREQFVALTEASADPEKWTGMVKGMNWAVVSVARPSDISGAGKFNAPGWFPVFKDQAVEIFVRRNATSR